MMKKIIFLISALIIGYSVFSQDNLKLTGSLSFPKTGTASVNKITTNMNSADSNNDNALATSKAINARIRALIVGGGYDSVLMASAKRLKDSLAVIRSLIAGGGGGAPISIGTTDSLSPVANGFQIVGGRFIGQSVDATHPGLMNTGTQTISGNKIWPGNSAFASFSMGTLNFTVPGSEAFKVSGTLGNAATFGVTLSGPNVLFDNDADGPYYFRQAGTAYYDMIIAHAGIQSLVGHTMAANLWLPGITTGVNTDSLLVIHNSDVRKLPIGALAGITITQLDSAFATLDTTIHSRGIQSTTSSAFNADTIYFTGGINERIVIEVEVIAGKVGGGTYTAKKRRSFSLISTTATQGTLVSLVPDEYLADTSPLSTYTFGIQLSGTMIIIPITPESATINATLEYRVKRLKL